MATKGQMKRWKEAVGKPHIPTELQDLRCGAKTRAGTPCKMKSIYINGRCKLHGGLSTGPTTKEGKRRVTMNLPNQLQQTP